MPTDDDKTVPNALRESTTLRGLGETPGQATGDTPAQSESATDPTPADPSSFHGEAIAPTSPDEASQRLLEALARRRRVERPVEAGAASNGLDAASYYTQHELREGTKTPAPLPAVVVTRTAEMPTVPGARLHGVARPLNQNASTGEPPQGAAVASSVCAPPSRRVERTTEPIGTPLPAQFRAAALQLPRPVTTTDRETSPDAARRALRKGIAIGVTIAVLCMAAIGILVTVLVRGGTHQPAEPSAQASAPHDERSAPAAVLPAPPATAPVVQAPSASVPPSSPPSPTTAPPPRAPTAVTSPMPTRAAGGVAKPSASPPPPTVPNRDLLE